MHNYRELKVWQQSVDFAVEVYKQTKALPPEEKYGLTSQIRRSAVSIASNIAEGAGRNTDGEFNQFHGIAYGSSCELDTQLIIANKLNFIKDQTFEELETGYLGLQLMIYSLKKSIR